MLSVSLLVLWANFASASPLAQYSPRQIAPQDNDPDVAGTAGAATTAPGSSASGASRPLTSSIGTTPSPKGNSTASTGTGKFTLVDNFAGDKFLDGWTFFTGADPTHGRVEYVQKEEAMSSKLAYVEDGVVVLAVDSTTDGNGGSAAAGNASTPKPIGGSTKGAATGGVVATGVASAPSEGAVIPSEAAGENPMDTLTRRQDNKGSGGFQRKSVRIATTKSYDSGLFIADFLAMPKPACSLWPAYWSVGPDWPGKGEIDILEGANKGQNNQITLHTGPGCVLNTGGQKVTSQFEEGAQCASSGANNNGCPFHDTDPAGYGDGFNEKQGGVFAHLWNQDGIKIWQFSRDAIPQDITAGNPDPASWPDPKAFFSFGAHCSADHFQKHSLTINTALCGDWAESAYGQSQCPGTCEDAVKDPKNFVDAKWKIKSIKVYSEGGEGGASGTPPLPSTKGGVSAGSAPSATKGMSVGSMPSSGASVPPDAGQAASEGGEGGEDKTGAPDMAGQSSPSSGTSATPEKRQTEGYEGETGAPGMGDQTLGSGPPVNDFPDGGAGEGTQGETGAPGMGRRSLRQMRSWYGQYRERL